MFKICTCSIRQLSYVQYIPVQVEREKLRSEEICSKTVHERSSLDRGLQQLEADNVEMQRQVQQMQAQLAEAEQQHAQR